MGRVAIESDVWQDPRFARLQSAMGWGRASTLGVLAILWHESRKLPAKALSPDEVASCVACMGSKAKKIVSALAECDYLKACDAGYIIVDNRAWQEKAARLRANASKGGLARASLFKETRLRRSKETDEAMAEVLRRQQRRLALMGQNAI